MFNPFRVASSSSRLLLPVVVAMCLVAYSGVSVATPAPGSPLPTPGTVYDDFLGPAGSPPDMRIWDYDIGPRGWGDNELQAYTNSSDNIRLDGQGDLVIQALKTSTGYTSGRLVTRGKLNMLYGRLSARIKFPSGQGIWPAFWLVGSNMDQVGWPQSGEIDMMELVDRATTYYVTLIGPQGDCAPSKPCPNYGKQLDGPIADLSTDFHTYWVNRAPDKIGVGVDETTLATFTPSSLPPGAKWVFNEPMYALLNIAVGGDWPGPPDESTTFPATMLVDWFRFDPSTP
jgi:beta-glucanase (GH16 family)